MLVEEQSLARIILLLNRELKVIPTWDLLKYMSPSQVVRVCTDIFQIVSRVEDLTEYKCHRVEYLGNLVFDDLVWHQSIVSLECLQTFRGGLCADPDDSIFWNLLMRQ